MFFSIRFITYFFCHYQQNKMYVYSGEKEFLSYFSCIQTLRQYTIDAWCESIKLRIHDVLNQWFILLTSFFLHEKMTKKHKSIFFHWLTLNRLEFFFCRRSIHRFFSMFIKILTKKILYLIVGSELVFLNLLTGSWWWW